MLAGSCGFAADGPSDGVLVAGAADDGVPVELGGVFEHHDLALELRGVGVEQVAGDPIHRVGLVQCRGGVAQSHLPAVRTLVGVGERGLDGCGHLVGVEPVPVDTAYSFRVSPVATAEVYGASR